MCTSFVRHTILRMPFIPSERPLHIVLLALEVESLPCIINEGNSPRACVRACVHVCMRTVQCAGVTCNSVCDL